MIDTIITLLAIQGLPHVSWVDVVDIALVAVICFYAYRLVKGTNVMRIFWALIVIFLLWKGTSILHMRLSSEIFGQFMSIGLIALIIVFQPEIRRFLLLIGTKTSLTGGDTVWKRILFWRRHVTDHKNKSYIDLYIQACMHMSQSKTGALIIFVRTNDVTDIVATGERIDALASAPLIETLFFKNSPLHDGAVIVQRDQVVAARCILPVSSNGDIDPNLGLRHRSAIGISEQTDVIAVIVSEETGAISYAVAGHIHHAVSPAELRTYLEKNL